VTDIRDEVRDKYAHAAKTAGDPGLPVGEVGCCGGVGAGCGCESGFGSELYGEDERHSLPQTALTASLGCGNPTEVASLEEGEVVLDLGSGGGIDVLLSARRVGPTGKVYGLDMTEEMLELALRNKAEAGVHNVEFLKGFIEAIPLPANTIDVVISNCVINLAADKPAVFREAFRVLRPGGRIGISDVVAANHLDSVERAERGSYVGCIAGALSFNEYEAGLSEVGFEDVTIEPTHSVVDGMSSAIIKARKPHDHRLPVGESPLPASNTTFDRGN
jgi:arsenite methyltransferase